MISQYIFLPWSIDISLVSQVFVQRLFDAEIFCLWEKNFCLAFEYAGGVWLLAIYMVVSAWMNVYTIILLFQQPVQ
jgi:hypothetical protein